MHDVAYVLLTGALFGVMLGYVAACFALSRGEHSDERSQ
jgi:hypothetical protein